MQRSTTTLHPDSMVRTMKKSLLILTTVLDLTVVHGQTSDKLIFPKLDSKILLIKAVGYDQLPIGEFFSNDSINKKLNEKIINELSLPFFQTVIKLNQCTRNFVSDTAGPNVLFLSTDEGGFKRHGLIIKEKNKEIKYPNLNYVDLVIIDEKSISEAALSIYTHELGHVMMANIMQDLPQGESVLQHVSMGITDYKKAFSEGWGEHFQILTTLNIPQYNSYFTNKNNYSNIALLWHSNMDGELRLNGTLQNKYIFQKLIPDNINTDTLNPEHLILLYHTSPLFNTCKLKNAQQMLSCEGMLSALFYQFNSNSVLQNNYVDNNFYNKFLLSPMSSQTNAQEIFTPYENVMLKNFFVWSKIKNKIYSENSAPVFIEFINEWCKSFPADKEKIIELFIKSTIGKTVSNETGNIYEKAAYYGMIGDYQNFKKLKNEYNVTIDGIVKEVINGKRSIDENIGKEIWVENKDLQVRTTLWSDKSKKKLRINLNTTSEYELASFGEIGLQKAKEIIKVREKFGSFKSLEEAVKYGFVR